MHSLDDLKTSHLHNLLLWEQPRSIPINRIIDKLSYVQIDSIHVVARSQDLVIHVRNRKYIEKEVWKELENKALFEGFSHARCLIPISHFKYHYASMVRSREKIPNWYKTVAKDTKTIKRILTIAEDEREITSNDIELPKDFPKFTGWTNPKKRILDFLLTRGYLITSRRDKFKLFYTLPEKHVKGFHKIHEQLPTREEEFWFHNTNSLEAMGPSMLHRLLHYKYNHRQIVINDKRVSPRILIENKVKTGDLATLEVRDRDGCQSTYYCLPDQADQLEDLPLLPRKQYEVFILSPFDNALWSREALLMQYGFDYKLECYVPQSKRVYGFFTLPILWGKDFVGRVDVKVNRKNSIIHFKQWSWEKGFRRPTLFINALARTMNQFCQFHVAGKINLGNLGIKDRERVTPLLDIPVTDTV